jgi:hypothetical protein
MARQLLNLRNVPEDEADDVRAFLDEHRIQYYETPPSLWGLFMGGIWIHRDEDYPRARALMDDYQARRAAAARAEYAARKRAGQAETLLTTFRRRPLKVLIYLALAAGILILMTWPVWLLAR